MRTILIIDDSHTQRHEIRAALEESALFERILEARDGMQGLKLLLSDSVDVVLCDLEMPRLDGEKLLRVKNSGQAGDVPFLFLSASTDLDRIARVLEHGACDVVRKPFYPPELVARLRLHLELQRLQDELRVKNERLAVLSSTDALTGLRNRRYASEVLSVEFLRARRYGTQLSLVLADLDHFKRVNDRYGHAAGDVVLVGTAERLAEGLRATDLAARWGGEEFLLILTHSDTTAARALSERWREAVASDDFRFADGASAQVTLSVGIASFVPAMDSPAALLAAADAALYRAKDAGRNRVAD